MEQMTQRGDAKSPISITEDDLLLEDGVARPLVAMVSGGCDSTALAYALADLADAGQTVRDRVLVFHVNHRLRGEASEDDAAFVRELAARLGFASKTAEVDVQGTVAACGGSLEAVARKLRYAAADEACAEWCTAHGVAPDEGRILTAHTLDDRVETFFMRAIVGTGPGGLASIPRCNGVIVRPLLDRTRDELEAYVREAASRRAAGAPDIAPASGMGEGFELWREDASNACDDYFRNFVRHRIVPVAREANPALAQTLGRTMDLIGAEDALMKERVDELAAQVVRYPANSLASIDVDALGKAPEPLRRRLLYAVLKELLPEDERITTRHIDAIVAHGAEPGFAIDLPGAIRVRNEYGTLAVFPISQVGDALSSTISLERVTVSGGVAPADYARAHASSSCIFVDEAALLEACGGDLSALELRTVEPGDTFCPLGMGGRHRKVSDILVDRKVPVRLRGAVRMLVAPGGDAEGCEVSGDIPVWLVGIATDERFRVGENPQVICFRTVSGTSESA